MPDQQIEAWRAYLTERHATRPSDLAALEDVLRGQMRVLVRKGLARDEAFLVALKRLGGVDEGTREFAREHAADLWQQLVSSASGPERGRHASRDGHSRQSMWTALALAAAAALAIKVPALFGVVFGPDRSLFYPLNIGFFTLPFVAAYFAWARAVAPARLAGLAAAFVLAAVTVNAFPFRSAHANDPADTHALAMLHLPIALWLLVGMAHVGGRWRGNAGRMDFICFTGEFFIHLVLIALGGGVLIGLTVALFRAIGIDAEPLLQEWIVPCGIAGATVIAAWLVEAKQGVAQDMAPLLARIFSPLFALVLLGFVATMVGTGRGMDVERDILIALDLLLVVVFGLLLYAISARDPLAQPGLFDAIQMVLLAATLAVDCIALWAIGERIAAFGSTPNRLAALGMNLVLLANLAGSAVLYARFLRGGLPFSRLGGWQMGYLGVIAGWAAVVVFVFPPLFGFR